MQDSKMKSRIRVKKKYMVRRVIGIMALWPVDRFERMLEEPFRRVDRFCPMRDMDWMGRQIMPYWRDADHSMLHVGNQTKEVVNDEKKFAVALDVSHFRPEELKVQLEGRDLTIEGHQEVKTEHGYIKKNFTHRWALPEDCDLDAVHTQIDNNGHLSVEAPKTGQHTKTRVIPIMPAPKK
ncbi:Hsp20/alpha crystallin family protein [Teladorsagia circumcincta]|uniref:Hsp20/alpha crystallin family protein n=1 Tax=Teladorsagia circumcincta TaxID=45464 RepID=A0A2G9UNW8_TELCI|nr:Hsp20/alpha crystallin family protein [Teladorsagia circumcincta]